MAKVLTTQNAPGLVNVTPKRPTRKVKPRKTQKLPKRKRK